MEERVCIIGHYLSPYVRKVLVFLHEKGIPYRIDPIVPFFGDERFAKLNPLRRIPVLTDGQVTLADSAVICQYLEEKFPAVPLYPSAAAKTHALGLEEFADTRLGEVFIGRLFSQVFIAPEVWGEKTDAAIVDRALTQELPPLLDYLETQLPVQGFLFGGLSIADIALACFFRNGEFAGYKVDAVRWPLTAAFVARVLGRPSFAALLPLEERLLQTPVAKHRALLTELGAPLTRDSHGVPMPQNGKPPP